MAMKKKINHVMKVVRFLRRNHVVTFPEDRNECTFLVDGETVILIIGSRKPQIRKGHTDEYVDLCISTLITQSQLCDWVYIYLPFMPRVPLYKMSIPVLVETGKFKMRMSLRIDMKTNYPIEVIAYTETRGNHGNHGNHGDHAYVKEQKRVKGKFVASNQILEGKAG